MDPIRPIYDRWDEVQISIGGRIAEVQQQINALRKSLGIEKAPATGGFIARLKIRTGDGVQRSRSRRESATWRIDLIPANWTV